MWDKYLILNGRNPYQSFKNDRHRLLPPGARDIRIVLVAAIVGGAAGAHPLARAILTVG